MGSLAPVLYSAHRWTGTTTHYAGLRYVTIPDNSGITSVRVSYVNVGTSNILDLYLTVNGKRAHAANEWATNGRYLLTSVFSTGENAIRLVVVPKSGTTGRFDANDYKLTIEYDDPYSACSPPTTLNLSKTSAGKSEEVTLSWSGAKAGKNNPITGYKVYHSTSVSGIYYLIGETTSTSFTVVSSPTNDTYRYYRVVTVGTVSGFDSERSAASPGLRTLWTDPRVTNVRLDGSLNAAYSLTSNALTLTWTGTNGTNNEIQSYTILRNGSVFKTGVTGTSYSVNAPASSGSSFYFSVRAIGPSSNSSDVNSPTVYAYVRASAPTSVSLEDDNVAPGAMVKLSWSGAKSGGTYNAINGYEVYRATSASGSYTLVGSKISSTATSGNVNVEARAQNGTSYFYKVVTCGARADSDKSSATAQLTTHYTAPSVTDLAMAEGYILPGSTTTMTWNGTNGENNPIVSYTVSQDDVVYRSGLTSKSLSVPAPDTAGENYKYAVRAIGQHSDSAAAIGWLYAYGEVSAPTEVSVSPDSVDVGQSATLSWSGAVAGDFNAITGYDVYRATSQDGNYSLLGSVAGSGTSGSLIVAAPTTMGNTYWFRVVTKGGRSNSARSAASASLTADIYSYVKAPTSVSVNPAITDASSQTVLSWSGAAAGTNNPITGYKVYRSTSATSGYTLLSEITTSATSGSMNVTAHASMGGKYYYKVETIGTKAGFTPSGMSSASAGLESKTYTAVGAPTAVTIAATLINPGGSVSITWNAAANGTNVSVAGYEVWKSENNGAYALLTSLPANALTFSETIGPSGTTQAYKILAKGDRSGYDSGFSSVVTAKSNSPPSSPASVSASPPLYESGEITITFPACTDVDGNFSHYQIQRRIQTVASGWGPWTNLNTSFTETSISDEPSVERGMRVHYQVKAHDEMGLYSDYTQSIQIQRNQAPVKPVVLLPDSGKKTYNSRPHIRVQAFAEPDGTSQSLQISIDGGAFTSVRPVSYAGAVFTERIASVLGAGVHSIGLRMMDNLGAASDVETVNLDVRDSGYARVVVKGGVISDESTSHQDEIEQLFLQVNELRSYYGLTAISVPDKVGNMERVVAGNIGMFAAWGAQMNVLQTAIGETWQFSGITPATWIQCTPGMCPTAAIIEQLRSEIARG